MQVSEERRAEIEAYTEENMALWLELGGKTRRTMSKKKKEYDEAYIKEHMAFQTVKVRKELLQRFKELVAANGDKVNTVLREAMERYVAEHEGGNGNEAV